MSTLKSFYAHVYDLIEKGYFTNSFTGHLDRRAIMDLVGPEFVSEDTQRYLAKVMVTICDICGEEQVNTRQAIEAGTTPVRCAGCGNRFGLIHMPTKDELERSSELTEQRIQLHSVEGH